MTLEIVKCLNTCNAKEPGLDVSFNYSRQQEIFTLQK